MSEKSILLIEPDINTGKFLAYTLEQAGYTCALVSSGKEGLIAAWRDQPDAIVIDITLPDIDSLSLVTKLRDDLRTQKTRLVGLVDRQKLDTGRLGPESGLNTFIIKQPDAVKLLLSYLQQNITQPIPKPRTSQITGCKLSLALLGCKGGAGVSSLCVNLAHAIAFHDRTRSTVVVDLAAPIGSLAEMTHAERHNDLTQLCQMKLTELVPTYLRQNLPAPRQWGFYLVPGPEHPWQHHDLTPNQVGAVLQALHAAFDNVIIDLGHQLSPLEFLALDYSSLAGLVFTPDEFGVGSALIYREEILNHGLDPAAVLLITNRPLATESLGAVALEQALGRAPNFSFPNLANDMHLTLTQHTPYPLRFPDENGTRQLEKFATQLIKLEDAKAAQNTGGV